MHGAILALPNTPSCRGAQLKKAQGQLYLLPTYLVDLVDIRGLSVRNVRTGNFAFVKVDELGI
jgi:hypothetical protein